VKKFGYSILKFKSDILIGVIYSKVGIRKIILGKSRKKILQEIKKEKITISKRENSKLLKVLKNNLDKYFKGEKIRFSLPLDLDEKTEFQKKVYKIVSEIPYGEVRTYKEIANKINSSPRAVGQALKRNSTPILIPCHRVIGKDNSYGGFSQGIFWKEKLLKIEKNKNF
jgi:methylated-DNA-[protein]-cysteine S-methyltransferase